MNLKISTSLAALLLITALQPTAFSAETTPADATISAPENIPTLEPITVIGRPEDPLTGSNTLDRATLEHLPAKNGSINEAISVLPGIQLGEQARPSQTAGEILPAKLSISGGKTYQNNFLIDGLSNNSMLDPLQEDNTSFILVPGHPQSLFVDTALVEEIEVYRYNIPASYGNFSGGVVNARLREPESAFFGEIALRETRSRWTKFHIDSDSKDDFDNSIESSYQPDFKKRNGSILINIPLNESLNLLTSYQRQSSEIPLQHLGSTKTQKRSNETYLLKLAKDIDERSRLGASFIYSPYEGEYFYKHAENSDFTIEGGGYQASLNYRSSLPLGELTLLGAIKGSRNDRDAPSNLSGWLANINGSPSSKPWGNLVGTTFRNQTVSHEGSVGSLESHQSGFQVKSDFVFNPFTVAGMAHRMSIGFDTEQVHGTLKRDEPANQYVINKTPAKNQNLNIICPLGSVGCIDGEQLFLDRFHYPAGSTSATVNLIDFYLEDKIRLQKFELRPGVRISYDDFMRNLNYAPRLAGSYDVLGNGSTLLIGGWNRYYGRTLLTYKLREATPGSHYQTRTVTNNEPVDWPEYVSPSTLYRFSEAKSPYSDEKVLGIDQEMLGGRMRLTWVRRDGKDEFSRVQTDKQDDGKKYYELSNNGESRHDEYTLEWERSWENHAILLNATYQESTSSNEKYVDTFDETDLLDEIWYEGSIISKTELPRKDYSRPWIVNLIYTTRLPWMINFTNVTRYRSGYVGLDSIPKTSPELDNLTDEQKSILKIAYKKTRFPEAWVFDWKFDREWKLTDRQSMNVALEINNVFNQRVQIGDGDTINDSSPEDYELGRQFWLGMTYKF